MNIVGLAGKKGSGKNTVSKLLRMVSNYSETSFADALRHELNYYINKNPDYIIQVLMSFNKHHLVDLVNKYKGRFSIELTYNRETKDEFRELMQFWGTEVRREEDAEYWINQIDWKDNLIITDVRFGGVDTHGSEVNSIRSMGGKVIYIEGPATQIEQDSHISEQLSPEECDMILHWDKKDILSCYMGLVNIANELQIPVTIGASNLWLLELHKLSVK